MALGDSDIAAGVFFGDFGDTVVFRGRSVNGNVDGASKDATCGPAAVSDIEYRVEVGAAAFEVAPKSGDRLSIVTGRYAGSYAVRSVDPVEDGATVEIKLRKL